VPNEVGSRRVRARVAVLDVAWRIVDDVPIGFEECRKGDGRAGGGPWDSQWACVY
jgi:hypothetical protein